MTTRKRKYQQAAVAYLIYGVLYLGGAVYLAAQGASARAAAPGGWIYFLVGLVMVVALPYFVWREYKWFTRILAVFVAFRVIGLGRIMLAGEGAVPLPGGGAVPMAAGAAAFLVVAGITCALLVRAGFSGLRPRRAAAR